MEEWQPIETAPDAQIVQVVGDAARMYPYRAEKREGIWGWFGTDDRFHTVDPQPTHWMPLPKPPIV